MSTMFRVRVGSIGMAVELDSIAEKLTGIVRFSKNESDARFKLVILKRIKAYRDSNGWRIGGFTKEETLKHLDELIVSCERVRRKGLSVWAWA